MQRAIRKAIADTAGNTGMVLTVAFDYGGHAELMSAVRAARAAEGAITQDAIARNLYLPELPPVDVLVRTSGEQRVSNFLLWQSAGATDPLLRRCRGPTSTPTSSTSRSKLVQ